MYSKTSCTYRMREKRIEMKNQVGVKKEIDFLGRLVIPKEMRVLFRLENEVELVVREDGILIRSPQYELVRKRGEQDL